MAIFDYFRTVLTAQLFYAFAVTMLIYAMSISVGTTDTAPFTDNVGIGVAEIGDKFDSSFNNQLGLPLVDIGSLVFFSGNIIADLILNFITAVPGMINVVLSGFLIFFPLDSVLQRDIKLFITVIGTALYLLSTMAFLLGARNPGASGF